MLYLAYGIMPAVYHAEPKDFATGARNIGLVVMAPWTHLRTLTSASHSLGVKYVNWL